MKSEKNSHTKKEFLSEMRILKTKNENSQMQWEFSNGMGILIWNSNFDHLASNLEAYTRLIENQISTGGLFLTIGI